MNAPRTLVAPQPRDWAVLVGLIGVAATLRAFAWSRTAVLFNDGPIFLALADALREGRLASVLAHPHHPLYPALVAGLEGLSLGPENAAVAVSIAGGLLAVAAIFWLAFRRFGATIAWASAAIVALHPWAVDFSSDVMSDGLYIGLYLAGLACLVDLLEQPSFARAALFGLLAGLAYLTRPEGLVLAALAAGTFAWRLATQPLERRAGIRTLACALGVCLLLIGGLRISEWRTGEGLALTQKKSVSVLLEGGPSAESIAEDRRLRRETRDDPLALPLPEGSIPVEGAGVDRPPHSLIGALSAAARVLATALSVIRYEVVLFAMVGVASLVRRSDGEKRWLGGVVAASLALYAGILLLLVWGAGYISRRHALAPGLALVPFAAVGWEAALRWLATRRPLHRSGTPPAVMSAPPRIGRSKGFALLAAVLVVSWGPRDLRARRIDRLAERRAAEWLAARVDAPRPVAAQKRRTAYYAGAPFVPLPDGRDGLIERQLRRRGARYLIIDRARLDDHLGLEQGIDDWLVPIHVERDEAQTVLVLELARPPAG